MDTLPKLTPTARQIRYLSVNGVSPIELVKLSKQQASEIIAKIETQKQASMAGSWDKMLADDSDLTR